MSLVCIGTGQELRMFLQLSLIIFILVTTSLTETTSKGTLENNTGGKYYDPKPTSMKVNHSGSQNISHIRNPYTVLESQESSCKFVT